MSFFNSNITGAGGSGGSGGTAGGLVTKFEKSVTIGSEATAEIVINLADDISNYQNITNEQIIVELQKISVSLDSGTSGYANLEHSYNQETGDLTITSSTSLMPFRNPSELTLPIAIYVAGAVQLPPAPESNIYKIGSKLTTTSIACAPLFPTEFTKLTAENFIIQPNTIGWAQGGSEQTSGSSNSRINYDVTTGLLTWSMGWGSSHGNAYASNYDVYCVLGEPIDLTGEE